MLHTTTSAHSVSGMFNSAGLDGFCSHMAFLSRILTPSPPLLIVFYSNFFLSFDSPVQEGVQEWKNRITVTTAPSSNLDKENEEEKATDKDDGCCSSSRASCCSGNGSRSNCAPPSPQRNETTVPFSSLLCYGCLTNLRDLDLKSMGSKDGQSESSFDLPPYVAEAILDRTGYESLEAFVERTSTSNTSTAAHVDPRESLREQIKDFLIDSDDGEDNDDG